VGYRGQHPRRQQRHSGIQEGVQITGKTGNVWEARFQFQKYRGDFLPSDFCAAAPEWVVEAHSWLPDTSGSPRVAWNDSRFDGQCTTTYYQYRNHRLAGTLWERNSERLTAFGWSVGIYPFFSLTNRSGASTRVTLRYVAGTQQMPHYICGNNASTRYALRVFAGH